MFNWSNKSVIRTNTNSPLFSTIDSHDSNAPIRVPDLRGRERGEVGSVGEGVHYRHHRQRDEDGAGEVPTQGKGALKGE